MRSYRHLYVHVPFCARRCSYCVFAIAVRKQVPIVAYVEAAVQELRLQWPEPQSTLRTLYLGGGTPSRLGGDGVAMLLQRLREHVRLADDAEVTMEANPEDVSPDAIRAWRTAGVNRLSIGIQSFSDRVLAWMHRVHTADDAIRAVHMARSGGIADVSLDLIFSVPASLNRVWRDDLQQALALTPTHLSLYGLTVEPHTPLGRWTARGVVTPGDEDAYVEEYLEAHARLTAAGFQHYEVSNFAMPDRRAAHNSAYWSGGPYLGIGPGAHGFDGATRRWNIGAYVAWQRRVASGTDPIEGMEALSEANRTAESVYLGLRTSDGLRVAAGELDVLAPWIHAGWIERVDSGDAVTVRCTPAGWLRLDRLAADLTALRSHS